MAKLDDFIDIDRAAYHFFGGGNTAAWATIKSIINGDTTLANFSGVSAALGDSMLAYARWNGTSYVWAGTAPTDGFTNVFYTGPTDPYTTTGVGNGRNVDGDLWLDTST